MHPREISVLAADRRGSRPGPWGSFLARSPTHAPGEFRSLSPRENRAVSDWSLGTADVARDPFAATKSPTCRST